MSAPASFPGRLLLAGTILLLPAAAGPGLRAQTTDGANSTVTISERPMPAPVAHPIFFPPVPPPLNLRIHKSMTVRGSYRTAAPELAPYAGEVFYPPLGARLARGTLTSALSGRLLRYRTERERLLTGLRGELARGPGQAPADRWRAHETFAQGQAAELAALEQQADQLRRDLTQIDSGWDDLRQWRLQRVEERGFSPFETAGVMRGAAFYLPELHPLQRSLLREIALELSLARREVPTETEFVFFSPDLARVALPDALPVSVAKSFAVYQAEKAKLKKELFDFILAEDKPGLNLFRGTRVRAFAERQAPALMALEDLAEKVRRELPPLAAPAPERAPLPPALTERVGRWLQAKAALREEAAAKIRPLFKFDAKAFVTYELDEEGLDVVPHVMPNSRGEPVVPGRKFAALQKEAGAIVADYTARDTALVQELTAILAEIGRALGTQDRTAISEAFAAMQRVTEQNAVAAGYNDYRAAVFEPGLSPAQRRLLFSAAVEQLALPLPDGELQPMER